MVEEFGNVKKSLPVLGVGLGLRRELAESIFAANRLAKEQVDWLEFIPENYMGVGGAAYERLQQAKQEFPLISHGINLSIGSTDEFDLGYLKTLKSLLDQLNVPWWSDHLCFSGTDAVYLHDLLPLPFSREALDHVVGRIQNVQNFMSRPFLIENISYYMQIPGAEMSEAQFLSEVLEQANCGLLLDVNNVYVNSVNHGFDAAKFLDQLPLERVVQIHVAGHKITEELVVDTHGAPVIEPVYELLRQVVAKTEVKAVLLERDQNFPDFEELLGELSKIRQIVELNGAPRTLPAVQQGLPLTLRN